MIDKSNELWGFGRDLELCRPRLALGPRDIQGHRHARRGITRRLRAWSGSRSGWWSATDHPEPGRPGAGEKCSESRFGKSSLVGSSPAYDFAVEFCWRLLDLACEVLEDRGI